MNDQLDEFLDGEREEAEVSAALREEAEAWERLVASLCRDVPGPAPPWLEGRIMAEVRRLDAPAEVGRPWFLRRRTVRLSPLGMGVAAAAVLALMVGPWLRPGPGRGAAGGAPAGPTSVDGSAPVVYVQFVLEAPGASSVAVSGDFNEWDLSVHHLEDADGDGVWRGRVPVRPGIHEYMFVIDGERWVTDPDAERYADDGFGNRNAVLAVAGADRT